MPTTKLEIICVVCGKMLFVDAPDTGDPDMDETMMSLAKRMTHDACGALLQRRIADNEERGRVLMKAAAWNKLCPKLYQTSHKWIEGPQAPKKVNLPAVKEAMAWNGKGRGLVMFGKRSGTGKSTAAWLVLRREFMRGMFIVTTTHGDLMAKATMYASGEEGKWAATLRKADVLFIDDLGKAKFKSQDGVGKAGEELLFTLIDYRTVNELRTIITCNYNSSNELEAQMSEERATPFVRRIREFFDVVRFDEVKGKMK